MDIDKEKKKIPTVKIKEDAKKVRATVTKAISDLMDKERISNRLMREELAKAGFDVSDQTVMNYTSLRKHPDLGTMIIMLGIINNVSVKEYTPSDIGLKIGPSFYSYS